MIAEFGVVWLGLGLALAGALALLPSLASPLARLGMDAGQVRRLASRLTMAHALAILASFACLVTLYVQSDFSAENVAANSHSLKPMLYKITGTWGNHEGSMLLWVVVLALYMLAFAHWQQGRSILETTTLAQTGLIAAGFELFILATSNPFARLFPPPAEGQGLNPLLQDIGLAIHPPMLYGGYVGFAIAFSIAVAALRTREDDPQLWGRMMRPWVLVAWSFLTLGIALGSWWAYRELGWGGWWFWDPVENASLMPWLAGTALVHSLVVLVRRGHFANWTLLLAILAFTLSLLGTFLVRSGILSSVHSFANDPTRGLYVLLFIAVVSGMALYHYARYKPFIRRVDFTPSSREGVMMLQNLLQMALCGTVLLGVLYPLAMQLADLPGVTVGAPYFEKTFIPIALLAALLAVAGPFTIWRTALPAAMRKRRIRQGMTALFAAGVLSILWWRLSLPVGTALWPAAPALLLGNWLALMSLLALWAVPRPTLAHRGMTFAHGGFALVIIAVALSSAGRVEKEVLMHPGESVRIGGYTLRFTEARQHEGANYHAEQAVLSATRDGSSATLTLVPEIRQFTQGGARTPEAAIHTAGSHDLYAVVGDARDSGYLIRFYVTPGMAWLWTGFLFVCFGGSMAAIMAFRSRHAP